MLKAIFLKSEKILVPIFLTSAVLFLFSRAASADTIYLKDKSALKGIVVEEYVDRIIYSTIEGEKEILKSDIIHIKFEEPADNLMRLGDAAFKKGYFKVALKYFMMGQRANQNISSLDSKIYHTEQIIYKVPETRKREHLALKNEIISGRTAADSSESLDPKQQLANKLGVKIKERRGRYFIKNISSDSSFDKAGARKGDAIISIWSKLCDYLTFKDLFDLLINPKETLMMVTIERTLVIPKNVPFDGKIDIKWEGAFIETLNKDGALEKAGFKALDRITAVDGQTTRYAPLKTITRWLQKKSLTRKVTIRRKLSVYKPT